MERFFEPVIYGPIIFHRWVKTLIISRSREPEIGNILGWFPVGYWLELINLIYV